MSCWAASLANCAQGNSREHYVSDGVFDSDTVIVFGLPWCRDNPVEIGLKNAVAKILCGKHNSALSKFDAEAAKLSRFLAKIISTNSQAEAEIALDGIFLEKWALKTFLNLGYLGALHRNQPGSISPPDRLVRYIFDDQPVPEGIGLYFISGLLDNRTYGPGVSWNVIQNPDDTRQVFGMALNLYGIRFIVSIVPVRAERMISMMGKVGTFDYASAQIVYRPTKITLNNEYFGRKEIHFHWRASEA